MIYFLNSGKKESLEEQYRVLSVQNGNILKNLKFYEGLEEDIAKMESFSMEVDERLFDSNELAANYNYFFTIEAKTGVRMSGLRQSDLNKGEMVKMGLKESEMFKEIRYMMSVDGSYEQLLVFLRELEGGKAFYRIENLAVFPSGEENATIKLTALVLGKKEVEA